MKFRPWTLRMWAQILRFEFNIFATWMNIEVNSFLFRSIKILSSFCFLGCRWREITFGCEGVGHMWSLPTSELVPFWFLFLNLVYFLAFLVFCDFYVICKQILVIIYYLHVICKRLLIILYRNWAYVKFLAKKIDSLWSWVVSFVQNYIISDIFVFIILFPELKTQSKWEICCCLWRWWVHYIYCFGMEKSIIWFRFGVCVVIWWRICC